MASGKSGAVHLPTSYWGNVAFGKFRTRLDPTKTNRGDYYIVARLFVTKYVDWLMLEPGAASNREEIQSALRNAGKKVQVFLHRNEWEAFFNASNFGEGSISRTKQKSSHGLHESEDWKEIMFQVAVELVNAVRSSKSRPIATSISKRAIANVAAKGDRFPKESTIYKTVARLVKTVWG